MHGYLNVMVASPIPIDMQKKHNRHWNTNMLHNVNEFGCINELNAD